MRSTGIVRKVDELGRIVIPKETRGQFDITEKDALEIFIDENEGTLILKKYAPGCIFCGEMNEIVLFKERSVCKKCMNSAVKLAK